MRTITQTEFTGISFKEADSNIFEIYDEVPAKRKGYVHILMKKSESFWIVEYCPKTKRQCRSADFNSFEIAKRVFEKLKN